MKHHIISLVLKGLLCKSEVKFVTDNQVNTKHLYDIYTMLGQRRRRWVDVVKMLYRCFLFTGKLKIYFVNYFLSK